MSLNPTFIYKPDFSKYLGTSRQAKYLLDYLDEIKAETCVSEEYIDKDYLVDFQKFYCRSFKQYPRFTDRFHFFQEKIDEAKFVELVEKKDKDGLVKLFDSYLGFIIKKPVSDEFGHEFIGRTMLKTYPKTDQFRNNRYFIANEDHVCLFGVPLKIESVPFQMQDQRVSACATISLWTTLHALSHLFEIPKSSPAEITESATSFISEYRNFPQGGLTIGQILKCIRSMGLDIEIIKFDPTDPNIIPSAVKAYLNAKIPLIALLRFHDKKGNIAYHAVVITGYKSDKNHDVIELYVHDDGVGPYSRVYPDKNFSKWKTDWNNYGYAVFLEQLIVPLYPKIRLQFKLIRKNYLQTIAKINKLKQKKDFSFELCLTTVQKYKNRLLIKDFDSKSDKIKGLFPKFLWVIRVYYKGKLFRDWIFDGTEVFPVQIEQSPIVFK